MRTRPSRRGARGIVLLETLIALLLFAIGLLGLLAAQTSTVRDAGNSRNRAIAAALADDLVGHMWLSDRTAATLQASFASSTGGSGYTSWLARVQASGLPNVDSYPPEVSFSTVSGGGSSATDSSLATITIRWLAVGETTAHSYTTLTQLK